jgi:glycosyltransferase involved in cell wall biosynthesis
MKQLISEKVSSANADKVQFIHLWSDDKNIEHISKDKNPLVKKWGLEGKFVLGYFGNMGRFHDIETIMQADKVIHKENSDIIFLFVGEGYKKELAIKYANKWGLSNCQFHHYVSREELKYSLSSADVGLVCLLKGQEGLSVPSKTFGLMAANIPIIAVMPGKSEIALIIKEENCGLVTKPGDVMTLVEAIYSLYRNPQKLKSMSENARKAIDLKYNLNLAAQKYYDIIRKVSAAR